MSKSVPLATLHAAAKAIRRQRGVLEVTADNDSDSGEVIFTTDDHSSYVLRLRELSDEIPGTDERGRELSIARAFLQCLGFASTGNNDAARTTKLLQLLADACEVIDPNTNGARQDALRLATQLAGLAQRLRNQ